ncbi:MAG: threonylcarbamoyl-AMP synthase [Lachnospiraceae bacterium]|nr:threonylcarbamoyl-AMP synthase [Lachnospiraceae bacterium]
MKTEIIKIEKNDSGALTLGDIEAIERAGRMIKEGGLVAFPTETVYGLGGNALDPESSKKIYAAKGRPSDNPLIVHISEWEDIYKIAKNVPGEAKLLADTFWPGPLTMILKKSEIVPKETTGGLDTVAVRYPSDIVAKKLIESAGGFVAAPSANISGKPSPTEAKYVCEDMDGRICAIIDGGEGEIGLESTIVDLTVSPPQILRPGFITAEMLGSVLGQEIKVDKAILNPDSNLKPRAPGMKYRHYAPSGELVIVEGDDEKVIEKISKLLKEDKEKGIKTGVMVCEEHKEKYDADVIKITGKRGDQKEAAHRLYSILRSFDDEDVRSIYSESFSDKGFGAAIMNRLLKAAGHKVISCK